jgi:PhzF family phenazine biosynthesis protein
MNYLDAAAETAGIPFAHIDAFTAVPFAGNPAAVCVLTEAHDDAWLQAVAREMNLSETAFVQVENGALRLRWFTPATEVPLCGHATLASAHMLFERGVFTSSETITFKTQSGDLHATKADGWITIDLPALPVTEVTPPFDIAAALGGPVAHIAANANDTWLVELASEAQVRALTPDFDALRNVHGVIATSRSATPAYDFVSRYFAPGVGINEDPVTGSAHCSLAPYWAAKLGKTSMTGYQASARGGVVRVRLEGERVFLSGQAVTVLVGLMNQPGEDSSVS